MRCPELNSCVGVVLPPRDGDGCHSAEVVGAAIVFGNGELRVRRAYRAADVVRTVEVVEGRDGQYRAAAYGVQPGEVHESIALVLDIADAGGDLLGSVRNLIVISAHGGHETKLIGWGLVKDEGGKSSQAGGLVIQDLGAWSFESKIGAVTREAPVVGEAFAMVSEADLVVGAVKTAVVRHQFGLPVAFKAGAGHHVEDSVGAVAIFGRVASALDFKVIDVSGIELGGDVGSDIGVGNGHAVEQPCDLVSATDVKLVVDHIRAGSVIGNHGQTVGLVGAWSLGNLLTADHAGGSRGFRINCRRSVNDLDGFF